MDLLYYTEDIDQTYELCLEAVKKEGLALYYVIEKFKSHEICLEAVKQNGLALYYIKNPSNEICLEAVKECPLALKYVKNQNYDLCLLAINNDPMALNYVNSNLIDENLCLIALKQNINTFKYIPRKLQTIEMINLLNDDLKKYILYVEIYLANEEFLKKIIDIEKKEIEECPICNENKKYYFEFTCHKNHYICFDCAFEFAYSKCYYRCPISSLNLDKLISKP